MTYVLNDIGSWADEVAKVVADDMDAGVICRAYTWLPGDFDPRTLRRRTGWALRRYRGEHRSGAWSVASLAAAVAWGAELTQQQHLRSLRRPFDPRPIYLGTVMSSGTATDFAQ